MNTFNTTFVTLSILSASLAVGCMGTTDPLNDPSASSTAALLEQPNGGMSTTDEAPQFADTSFTALPAMTPTVGTDTVLDESGSFALDAAPAAQRHVSRVLILWGHLPRPRDSTLGVEHDAAARDQRKHRHVEPPQLLLGELAPCDEHVTEHFSRLIRSCCDDNTRLEKNLLQDRALTEVEAPRFQGSRCPLEQVGQAHCRQAA